MKDILTLAAEKRTGAGSRDSRRLRDQMRVPCIVYGHKQDPQSISVDLRQLSDGLRQHARMLDLDIDGQKQRVLLIAAQYDTFGIEVIHADFQRVAMDEKIHLSVPVTIRGHAAGEKQGGIVEQLIDSIEIECLPGNIPESLVARVQDLGVGQSLHASDIELPEGVKLLSDPGMVLVTVAAPKVAAEEEAGEAAAGATEPEIIGQKEQEEEQQD